MGKKTGLSEGARDNVPALETGQDAPVVESVDAVDSKSTVRKDVGVQVSPGAPIVFLDNSI